MVARCRAAIVAAHPAIRRRTVRRGTQLHTAEADRAVPGRDRGTGVVGIGHEPDADQRTRRFAEGAPVVPGDIALVLAPLPQVLQTGLDDDLANAVTARIDHHAFERRAVVPHVHQRRVRRTFASDEFRQFEQRAVLQGQRVVIAVEGEHDARRRVLGLPTPHIGPIDQCADAPREPEYLQRIGLQAYGVTQHAGRGIGSRANHGGSCVGAKVVARPAFARQRVGLPCRHAVRRPHRARRRPQHQRVAGRHMGAGADGAEKHEGQAPHQRRQVRTPDTIVGTVLDRPKKKRPAGRFLQAYNSIQKLWPMPTKN